MTKDENIENYLHWDYNTNKWYWTKQRTLVILSEKSYYRINDENSEFTIDLAGVSGYLNQFIMMSM